MPRPKHPPPFNPVVQADELRPLRFRNWSNRRYNAKNHATMSSYREPPIPGRAAEMDHAETDFTLNETGPENRSHSRSLVPAKIDRPGRLRLVVPGPPLVDVVAEIEARIARGERGSHARFLQLLLNNHRALAHAKAARATGREGAVDTAGPAARLNRKFVLGQERIDQRQSRALVAEPRQAIGGAVDAGVIFAL